jgi:tmRNA-binding protein
MTDLEPPLFCRVYCRCRMCVRTALHLVKRKREGDKRKQTRSRKTAHELDSTAALARALRTVA